MIKIFILIINKFCNVFLCINVLPLLRYFGYDLYKNYLFCNYLKNYVLFLVPNLTWKMNTNKVDDNNNDIKNFEAFEIAQGKNLDTKTESNNNRKNGLFG